MIEELLPRGNPVPGKTFSVEIGGVPDRVWKMSGRGFADIGCYIIRHPQEFDLNHAKLGSIIQIKNVANGKIHYYRLRNNGHFIVDRVEDVIGIRDIARSTAKGE